MRAVGYTKFDKTLLKHMQKMLRQHKPSAAYKRFKQRVTKDIILDNSDLVTPPWSNRPAGSTRD